MNDIEYKIKNVLLQDIEIPSDYKYIIRNTLKEKKEIHRSNQLVKILATGCICIIVTISIAYAKDISNFINIFFNHNRGIDLAINEGYIDNPNMNYVHSGKVEGYDNNKIIINAADTEIKVKNMLMDDYNLSFTFSIKLDNNIDISKITDIWFPEMLISDDNNNLILCTERYLFDEYCTENKLNYIYGEFNKNYINSGINYYTKAKITEDNTIELIYNFNASVYPYPKSKKLYIDIRKVNILRGESYEQIDQADVVLNGNWNIDFDVSEKFYNREAIIYNVKSCTDQSINITEVCVYNTGMVLEFTSKDKPIWNDGDSTEVQRQKLEEFGDYVNDLKSKNIKFINDEYVKNEKGEIFKPVDIGFDGSGIVYEYNGNFKHWQTYDLIKEKATDKLTVYIDLFLQGNRRNVVIELERILNT